MEKEDAEVARGLTVWEGSGGSGESGDAVGGSGSGGLYGDAEARAFYEDLPDMLLLVPLSVLGLTPEQVSRWAGGLVGWWAGGG